MYHGNIIFSLNHFLTVGLHLSVLLFSLYLGLDIRSLQMQCSCTIDLLSPSPHAVTHTGGQLGRGRAGTLSSQWSIWDIWPMQRNTVPSVLFLLSFVKQVTHTHTRAKRLHSFCATHQPRVSALHSSAFSTFISRPFKQTLGLLNRHETKQEPSRIVLINSL